MIHEYQEGVDFGSGQSQVLEFSAVVEEEHDSRTACRQHIYALMQGLEYLVISIWHGEQHNQVVVLDVLRLCAKSCCAEVLT